MAYTGFVRFIEETQEKALVQETAAGASSPDKYTVLNADFSAVTLFDTITYTYNAASTFNDGRDITISAHPSGTFEP
jgi:hypothetical protein